MKRILRGSRYFVVLVVVGCLVMFAAVTIYAAIAVGNAIVHFHGAGMALSEIASVTVYAFKILDLFLLERTPLHRRARARGAVPVTVKRHCRDGPKVHELQDLKIILFAVGRRRQVVAFSATCSNGKPARISSSSVAASQR